MCQFPLPTLASSVLVQILEKIDFTLLPAAPEHHCCTRETVAGSFLRLCAAPGQPADQTNGFGLGRARAVYCAARGAGKRYWRELAILK